MVPSSARHDAGMPVSEHSLHSHDSQGARNMKLSRRSLLASGVAIVPVAGLGPAIAAADGFRSSRPGDGGGDKIFHGYGALAKDPKGFIDLPRGFKYRIRGAHGSPARRSSTPSPNRTATYSRSIPSAAATPDRSSAWGATSTRPSRSTDTASPISPRTPTRRSAASIANGSSASPTKAACSRSR
jgi:hypothetical protein